MGRGISKYFIFVSKTLTFTSWDFFAFNGSFATQEGPQFIKRMLSTIRKIFPVEYLGCRKSD